MGAQEFEESSKTLQFALTVPLVRDGVAEFSPTLHISIFILHDLFHALSVSIGKVVASHAEGCRVDYRLGLHPFILYMHEAHMGYCPSGWGCDQSI